MGQAWSAGFYELMIAKGELLQEIRSTDEDHLDLQRLARNAYRLRMALACLAGQLNDKGARIGALVGFNGPAVEKHLRDGIIAKGSSLSDIVRALGPPPFLWLRAKC
jgi:hypothetical protein